MKIEQRSDGAIIRTAETAEDREKLKKDSPTRPSAAKSIRPNYSFKNSAIKNNRKRTRGRIVQVHEKFIKVGDPLKCSSCCFISISK